MKGSSGLLASPRRRRRAARIAVLLVVAGAVAFGITRLTLNENVRDKDVTFKVKLLRLQQRILPEWDELPSSERGLGGFGSTGGIASPGPG